MRTPEEIKAYMRQYYAANKDKWARTEEKNKERNRRRRERYATDAVHRSHIKATVKRWQAGNPEKRFAQRLNAYKITVAEYIAIFEQQGGVCAICGRPGGDKRIDKMHVDHCHSTGTVRGLLCTNCNFAIGHFNDDPKILDNAAAYLRLHKRKAIGQGAD